MESGIMLTDGQQDSKKKKKIKVNSKHCLTR